MKQFVHVVGTDDDRACSPNLEPPGLAGRDGGADPSVDSGGVVGVDCGPWVDEYGV